MAITDPYAIRTLNEYLRPSSDRLQSWYYGAQTLSQRWLALGSDQSALDVLRQQFVTMSEHAISTNDFVHSQLLKWASYSSLTGQPPIPNTDEIIEDGRTDVPQVTGADATDVVNRIIEWINWGDTGDLNPDPLPLTPGGGGAFLYTQIDPSQRDPDLAAAGLFINRCNEYVADLEANNGDKLSTLIALSVNAQSPI